MIVASLPATCFHSLTLNDLEQQTFKVTAGSVVIDVAFGSEQNQTQILFRAPFTECRVTVYK